MWNVSGETPPTHLLTGLVILWPDDNGVLYCLDFSKVRVSTKGWELFPDLKKSGKIFWWTKSEFLKRPKSLEDNVSSLGVLKTDFLRSIPGVTWRAIVRVSCVHLHLISNFSYWVTQCDGCSSYPALLLSWWPDRHESLVGSGKKGKRGKNLWFTLDSSTGNGWVYSLHSVHCNTLVTQKDWRRGQILVLLVTCLYKTARLL